MRFCILVNVDYSHKIVSMNLLYKSSFGLTALKMYKDIAVFLFDQLKTKKACKNGQTLNVKPNHDKTCFH